MTLSPLIVALSVTLTLLAMPVSAVSFQLEASGTEPLYQTRLPKEVYQFTQSNRLQDLTITNAAGEQVPYALMPTQLLPTPPLTDDYKSLAIYPIQQNNLNNPQDIQIQLEKNSTQTTVNIASKRLSKTTEISFLLDAGKAHPALNTVSVEWQGSENRWIELDLLASDDLKSWLPVGSGVLLKNQHNGHSLLQNTLRLDTPTLARYLQLRPKSAMTLADFNLTQATAVYSHKQKEEPSLDWQSLPFLVREQNNQSGQINLVYESPGRYPVSQLQIKLPEDNTITMVAIYVRNTTQEPWRYLTQALLYRMMKKEKTVTNPDTVFSPVVARYWQLQFNQTSGGLGVDNPSLYVGWQPETLVWNARGKAPFTLQVGEQPKLVNTLAFSNLLPDYTVGQSLALPTAPLILNGQNKASVTATPDKTWVAPIDYKRWLLWGGLILGVLLLAGMCYSLLKKQQP